MSACLRRDVSLQGNGGSTVASTKMNSLSTDVLFFSEDQPNERYSPCVRAHYSRAVFIFVRAFDSLLRSRS